MYNLLPRDYVLLPSTDYERAKKIDVGITLNKTVTTDIPEKFPHFNLPPIYPLMVICFIFFKPGPPSVQGAPGNKGIMGQKGEQV